MLNWQSRPQFLEVAPKSRISRVCILLIPCCITGHLCFIQSIFYSVRMQENKDQYSSEYGLFSRSITRNNKQYMLLICIERSNKTLNPGLIEIPMIYHDIDWSSKRRQPLWEPWSWQMKTKNHHFEKFYFTLCFLVYFL